MVNAVLDPVRHEATMMKVRTLLLLAAIAFPSDAFGGGGASVDQFGCADPEALYNILNLAEPSGARKRATLIAKNCMSLAGAHYLLLGEEDGLAKIRVFAKRGDWATSSVVFTLDEMLDADEMVDPSAIAHQ
jgi:hypothetical protein